MNTFYREPFALGGVADEAEFRRRHDLECMHCQYEPVSEQRAEFGRDHDQPVRRQSLLMSIKARRGTDVLCSPERFSSHLIVEQAAYRFFELVAGTEDALKGRFDSMDFSYMLNTTCTPIWSWDPDMPMATMVASDHGISSLDHIQEGHPLRKLLEKLIELTPLENAVLVDVCERVWRGHDNPLL